MNGRVQKVSLARPPVARAARQSAAASRRKTPAHASRASSGHTFADVPVEVGGEQPVQASAKNPTGLPERLKTGIESLSGVALDHVSVHRNSPRPVRLGALAFTQGTDIHIAPGQEQHLPHEAWHAVQQTQGRVRPTVHADGGVALNDDVALEREADAMGTKAMLFRAAPETTRRSRQGPTSEGRSQTSQPRSSLIAGPTFVTQLRNGKRKKQVKWASQRDAPAREAAREAHYAAGIGGGARTFENEEGRLPRAPRGHRYIETDVGAGRVDRGRRRLVSLVDARGRIVRQHNTEDHYRTFH